MGAIWNPAQGDLELCDRGNAPEYFVEAIGKRELLPGGIVRSFACKRSGNLLIPQYTYVASIDQLALMARATLDACAKMHTEATLAVDWTVFAKTH